MKNIGIMSMQRIVNYGSFLQAYGLKEMVESLGYTVEYVDYEYQGSIISEESKFSFFGKLPKLYSIVNNKILSKKFKKNYQSYLKKYLNINENKNIRPLNISNLIIGSDEVFNCMQGFPVGYSKELFGQNYDNINIISYAGSFGFTTIKDLKEHKIDKEIGSLLSKFNSISVRDENSYSIVKDLTNHVPSMHLDPVLIANFDYLPEIKNKIKNYIIIYAYPNRLTKDEKKYIKSFAKKYNKKLISLGFYQDIADFNLIVEPLEVLSYLKNADFVITDTFHGTIFSIKMNTNFCTIIRDSNKNKLSYLLSKMLHEDRMVKKLDEIEKLFNKNVDFSKSNNIISEEREKSLLYLKENLK